MTAPAAGFETGIVTPSAQTATFIYGTKQERFSGNNFHEARLAMERSYFPGSKAKYDLFDNDANVEITPANIPAQFDGKRITVKPATTVASFETV